MHDPSSIFRFEEHDIYLPMVTLEELDNNKKGVSEVARNARQTSRNLEEIIGTNEESLEKGRSLGIKGNTHVTGKLSYKLLHSHMICQCSLAVKPTIKF